MSTSLAKPSGYHHGDLREALVAAGLAILEEGGDPKALSLREAARRAGVSAMAPYRHFADKEALLAAVAAVGFGRLREALLAADGRGSGREALVGQGVAYVAFACANPALFRLMFGSAPCPRDGDLDAASRSSFAVLTERVAALVPPAEAADWALHCWATVHGLAALSIDGQFGGSGENPEAMARRVLSLSALPSEC
nr:TetR/AcrR family transcriptional regulator [Methylobacterium haplocladii]